MRSPVKHIKLIEELDMFSKIGPSCFTPEQWEDYRKAVLSAPPQVAPVQGSFCEHCEPWYQKLMCAAKLCGHPETKFTLEDRSWVGTRKVGVE